MTKNEITELHNKVSELHQLTNAAMTGRSNVTWEQLIDTCLNLLLMANGHNPEVKKFVRFSEEPQLSGKLKDK